MSEIDQKLKESFEEFWHGGGLNSFIIEKTFLNDEEAAYQVYLQGYLDGVNHMTEVAKKWRPTDKSNEGEK